MLIFAAYAPAKWTRPHGSAACGQSRARSPGTHVTRSQNIAQGFVAQLKVITCSMSSDLPGYCLRKVARACSAELLADAVPIKTAREVFTSSAILQHARSSGASNSMLGLIPSFSQNA